MTKKSVRMLSLILAAALLVVCCLSGCGDTLTIEELCEMVKEDFPEAHVAEVEITDKLDDGTLQTFTPRRLFFFKDEATSEYLTDETFRNGDRAMFSFYNLRSAENTRKILNAVMPIIVDGWTTSDTEDIISEGNPNEDFTKWMNENGFTRKYQGFFDYWIEEDGGLWIAVTSLPVNLAKK